MIAAPALVRLGVHPMAAHLFVFYYGTLGNISPPVAPVSFAAAGIAGSDPVKTTNLAFLYVFPSFLVLFLFVYYTEILLIGSIGIVLYSIFSSFIAISSIAIAFQGFLFQNLRWVSRAGFLIAGLLLVYPYWITDLVGYLLLAILVFLHVVVFRAHRKLFITKSE